MFDYRVMPKPKNVCNVEPVSTAAWLAPLIGGAIGGLGGLFSGGGDQTSTTQIIPPQLTGQQQIMLNELSNYLYGAMPQYQNYINQTLSAIYGGAPGAPTVGGVSAADVPGQLSGELGQAVEQNVMTQAEYERAMESYNKAKSVPDALGKMDKLQAEVQRVWDKYGGTFDGIMAHAEYQAAQNAKQANLQVLKDFGLSDIKINEYKKQYLADPEGFTADFVGESPSKGLIVPTRTEYLQMAEDAKDAGDYKQMKNYLELSVGNEAPYPDLLPEHLSNYLYPKEAEGYSPFKELMSWSPEKIESYYGSERQKAQKEIGDWQSQALREMEQRAVGQSGGYLGSGPSKDLSTILGKGGELSTGINLALNQAEQAMKMDQPLQQLEAAYGALQRLQGMQTPWMSLGAGLTSPYGATTQIQTQPGASTGANMLGGALGGLVIAGMGQSLGWFGSGQPATNFGYGLTGQSANPYQFQTPGFQNYFNQNPWSLG